MKKPTRTTLIAAAATALLVSGGIATGTVVFDSDESKAGMSSSALTGWLGYSGNADDLAVSFKVVDSLTGDIVWQASQAEITRTVYSGYNLVSYNVTVDPAVAPLDPRYEWVWWVYAARAQAPVTLHSLVYNDFFNVNHVDANLPQGNIQGRIIEAHVDVSE